MNLLGRFAQVYVPPPVRWRLLSRLFKQTAAAFGSPSCAPPPRRATSDEILSAFANYTSHAAVEPSPSPETVQRLFEVTRGDGAFLRHALGVTSTRDVMAVARLVYRALGIEFAGDTRGDIMINRCYFSTVYSPDVCRVMSALDAGLLAGLSGGGQLAFSQRITEGFTCCRARLIPPEAGR